MAIANTGDKGISIGEKSNAIIRDAKIAKSNVCIASKDESAADINGLEASNCKYGFTVYQKKPEYGPASINAVDAKISSSSDDYLVEKGSSLSLNGKIILGTKKKVYDLLYGA